MMIFNGGEENFLSILNLFALSLIITGVIVMIFGKAMPRRTHEGVRAYQHARGFEQYLEKAEKYRLEWHEKENIFEKFLPFAMIFGVVDKWSDAFKQIDLPESEWYEGQSLTAGRLNVAGFTAAIGGLESGLARAVSAEPQKGSSGSGVSGGFSGGGFGGGGGGSW
jgi:uncharacterized membrane protein